MYFSSKVAEQTVDFQKNVFATDTAEYRMFKTYFESQSALLNEADLESLQEQYYNGKIVKLPGLDKFLKDNKLTFDFEHSIALDHEDHEH